MTDALYVGSNHGRPNLAVGSTPGTAGPQTMSGSASLQPGPFDPGSFVPRRVVNQKQRTETNHSIPVSSVIRRFRNGSDQFIKKGQFTFLYNPSQGNQQPFTRTRMENMMNLPMVNFYLAQLTAKGALDITAAAVSDRFVPHGVVLTSQGGEAGSMHQERLMNCTVAGFANTFNLWGEGCRGGTRLYFIYKKVATQSRATNHSLEFSLRFNRMTESVPVPDSVGYVWAVEPWSSPTDAAPPLDVLLGDDGKYGVARYVGRVNNGRRVQCLGMQQMVMRDVNAMVNQPQFTMFIDL